MGSVLLMNFIDVARSLGRDPLAASPNQVADFIRREYSRAGGLFNYNPAIEKLYDVFRGALSAADAEEFCRNNGVAAGRKPNGDAIRLAGAFAEQHRSQCYRTPFTAVPVGRLPGGRTAYMAIKAPLVRVAGDDVYVVVPGFRMNHRPQAAEIDVAASFALATFARDDFEGADFEYVNAGPGVGGERVLEVHRGRDRRIYDVDTVDRLLEIYVAGLVLALDAGMPAQSPNFRGYRVGDPDQPRFI